jgi:predicted dehydrogenase
VKPVRIGVIGVGVIGKTHLEAIRASENAVLGSVADPSEPARALAEKHGAKVFTNYEEMLDSGLVDGVIVSVPNAEHLPVSLACIKRKLPLIVEKPITESVAAAKELCDAADAAGVPVLTGHHRRHNPIMRAAKAAIVENRIGKPIIATAMYTWLKPDRYYDIKWRTTRPGGGPILINLIHEIDVLRYLFGEIESLFAFSANTARGFEVEDTASVTLRFQNGALGTISVSDATPSPAAWDLNVGEAPQFDRQNEISHYISGTDATITLPNLRMWRYQGDRGNLSPLTGGLLPYVAVNPYVNQIDNFAGVIRGAETPVCSGLDGMKTLEATLAVQISAETGKPVSFT